MGVNQNILCFLALKHVHSRMRPVTAAEASRHTIFYSLCTGCNDVQNSMPGGGLFLETVLGFMYYIKFLEKAKNLS